MHKDPAASVTHKESWGTYHMLTLNTPEIATLAAPGQFIMVRTSLLHHPLLRRPFSIHAVSGTELIIFFQSVGVGTRLLSLTDKGQALDILGPLGQGFDLSGDLKGFQAALVGGGRGIAPLFFLAGELRKKGADVRIFYGGKSEEDLVLRERFAFAGFAPDCSTEDASYGYHGLVTDLVIKDTRETYAPDRLFACGPDGMLQAVGELAHRLNIPAELSLESIMGCGFGACWGCVHKIRKDGEEAWRKICEEGPVFLAEDVVWRGEDR
ncbi:MAG: dihydroorotate dehydrogenase electron transfer subunit [Candidatus Aminicenantaceae bacterium]